MVWRMNWISEKITNGLAYQGTISAHIVLSMCRVRTTIYSGTIVTSNGMRNVASIYISSQFFLGNGSRAKKYAPMVLKNRLENTTAVETISELSTFCPKL